MKKIPTHEPIVLEDSFAPEGLVFFSGDPPPSSGDPTVRSLGNLDPLPFGNESSLIIDVHEIPVSEDHRKPFIPKTARNWSFHNFSKVV